jgi:hypothetical protein
MELFGGGRSSGNADLKKTQERQQRESLASFARQQGELDQAAVAGMAGGGASSRGRGLLTYLNRGAGQSTVG